MHAQNSNELCLSPNLVNVSQYYSVDMSCCVAKWIININLIDRHVEQQWVASNRAYVIRFAIIDTFNAQYILSLIDLIAGVINKLCMSHQPWAMTWANSMATNLSCSDHKKQWLALATNPLIMPDVTEHRSALTNDLIITILIKCLIFS